MTNLVSSFFTSAILFRSSLGDHVGDRFSGRDHRQDELVLVDPAVDEGDPTGMIGFVEGFTELFDGLGDDTGGAEGLRQFNVVRRAIFEHRVGIALSIEEGLPLADHAEDLVVHDDDGQGQFVENGGHDLVEVHTEGAVARDEDGGLFRTHTGAFCRTHAEAHGTESAAGDELAGLAEGQVLCRPHLVLADVGGNDGVIGLDVVDDVHDVSRVDAEGLGVQALLFFHKGVHMGAPLGVFFLLDTADDSRKRDPQIATDTDVCGDVLGDLREVDIHVDDGRFLAELAGLPRHAVREAGADGDDQVGVILRDGGSVLTVHTDHAEVTGVLIGDAGDAHEGTADDRVDLVGEFDDIVIGFCRVDAAADVDERLLRLVDGRDRFGDAVLLGLDAVVGTGRALGFLF